VTGSVVPGEAEQPSISSVGETNKPSNSIPRGQEADSVSIVLHVGVTTSLAAGCMCDHYISELLAVVICSRGSLPSIGGDFQD